jgi:hypothetical protein
MMLHARILWELVRFDILLACRGLRGVRAPCRRTRSNPSPAPEIVGRVREAFAAVAPFYWKPIRCLQRSIVTARVMRRYGIRAEVVIGYRPSPFFSHAWVEVAGRVVNDSSTYQRRLHVLERLWAEENLTQHYNAARRFAAWAGHKRR